MEQATDTLFDDGQCPLCSREMTVLARSLDQGVDASVRAWSATKVGWLWRLLKLPGISPLADRVYALWAERRYRRLYRDPA